MIKDQTITEKKDIMMKFVIINISGIGGFIKGLDI